MFKNRQYEAIFKQTTINIFRLILDGEQQRGTSHNNLIPSK